MVCPLPALVPCLLVRSMKWLCCPPIVKELAKLALACHSVILQDLEDVDRLKSGYRV